MKWIRDEEFVRGSVPMSKFDIRVLVLAWLEIGKDDCFVDIGAGTGSISVQASLMGAEVYAVEEALDAIELIRNNAEKFDTEVKILQGTAPNAIAGIGSFSKCFIGGSGGKLPQIVKQLDSRLQSEGLMAASFIVPDNMVEMKRLLSDMNYKDIEVKLIQVSTIDGMGLMKANNPIFLIKGKKP